MKSLVLVALSALAAVAGSVGAQAAPMTSRLEGQVIDPVHEPVANAEVVVEHDGLVVARTRSDGNGIFVFPRVPAEHVVVQATTDAPNIGALAVDLWGTRRGFAQVRTMPARRIQGVVRDAAGAPIAGAWVAARCRRNSQLGAAHCETRTNANGEYSLTHAPLGAIQVTAWTGRVQDAAHLSEIRDPTDVTLDLRLTRDDAEWSTVELRGGTAAERAAAVLEVAAFEPLSRVPLPAELRRPRPVAAGRWQVPTWPGAKSLHVRVRLVGAHVWPSEHSWPSSGTLGNCSFRIGDPDATIRGRLVDRDGRPVASLEMLAESLQVAPMNNARRSLATTNERGEFTLQSPVGPTDLFAVRAVSSTAVIEGREPLSPWLVGRHDSDTVWQARVAPGRSVSIRLHDLANTPVAGVLVDLRRADSGASIGRGITGLDGIARVHGLRVTLPTELEIVAWGSRHFARIDATMGQPAPGESVIDLGQHELGPGATIRGVVRDELGQPRPGRPVQIRDLHGRTTHLVMAANREGRFVVRGLPPGRYVVSGMNGNGAHDGRARDGEILEIELVIRDR